MATTTIPWRKRSIDSDSSRESKRSKTNNFYIRLESESPVPSEEDTESVYSIQEKETDVVRDTSDTDSKSNTEIEFEYEVASSSGSDRDVFGIDSSTGSDEDIMLMAAAVCDSSIEFITDVEDSDNSRQDDSSTGSLRGDFWTCTLCKSQNNNPQYRFCDKCYQDRKTFFPPRPRRFRKARRSKQETGLPVQLDALKSCLSGLSQDNASSQDSGLGSSQEFPSLCLDQIVVPKHLSEETPSTSFQKENAVESGKNRKRQISESSLSEYEVETSKRPKVEEKKEIALSEGENAENNSKKLRTEDNDELSLPESAELCIMCNAKPKNSIFLHGRIAHMCCCYKCAMRTWRTLKRCPICNRKVNNVVRVFTT